MWNWILICTGIYANSCCAWWNPVRKRKVAHKKCSMHRLIWLKWLPTRKTVAIYQVFGSSIVMIISYVLLYLICDADFIDSHGIICCINLSSMLAKASLRQWFEWTLLESGRIKRGLIESEKNFIRTLDHPFWNDNRWLPSITNLKFNKLF